MATDPPQDLVLAPLKGDEHTVREWLTTFHLAFVALDPYSHQSAWLLDTAMRVLTTFDQADVRVAVVVTAPVGDALEFLGPYANDVLVFLDPDRKVVNAFGLERLPAIVHLGMDGTVVNAAEGWDPKEWRTVVNHLAKVTSWLAPVLPGPRDPGPFEGAPAP